MTAETLRSMHRWYLEGFTSSYLFVNKRLSRKLFSWLVPWVCEKESKEDDKFPRFRGAGVLRGAAGHAESLEARGHRSGALRADHTLLLPYRPQDVWQRQGTDGGVCVQCFAHVILAYAKRNCKVGKYFNKEQEVRLIASVLHWNVCTMQLNMEIALKK